LGDLALGLEIVEQETHALEVLERLEIVEQVGVAAHDQLAVGALAAGPAGEPGLDEAMGERVELGAARVQRLLDLDLGLAERAAADARIEEIRRLDERRDRQGAPAGGQGG